MGPKLGRAFALAAYGREARVAMFPVMKGHEDGGMFFGQEEECVSSPIRHDP